uniref:CCHC-type domain-containing protein n=1 Tax=Trichuris muris TaxID=70415 RepID=A0A5S6QVE4_TRIMR
MGSVASGEGVTNGDRGRIGESLTPMGAPLPMLGASTPNALHWFERLDAFFEMHGTAEERKAAVLRFYLTDELRQVLPGLGVETGDSYGKVRQTLLTYLQEDSGGIVARNLFFSRRQQGNERLQAFMANLRILCAHAFPTLNKTEQGTLLVDQFTRGVRSDMVRAALIRARCDSAESALDLALAEERDIALISRLSSPAEAATISNIDSSTVNENAVIAGVASMGTEGSEIRQLTSAIRQLLSHVTSNRRPSRERRRPNGRPNDAVICYNCRGRGHVSRQCPSRARRPGNEHPSAFGPRR